MSERPKFTSHEEYIASMPSDVQKEKHCMSRRLISSGSQFESEIGYSRAVVDGNWVFVSGTTGFDYQTMTIAEGLSEQTEQCLRNIDRCHRAKQSARCNYRTWCKRRNLSGPESHLIGRKSRSNISLVDWQHSSKYSSKFTWHLFRFGEFWLRHCIRSDYPV